MGWTSGVGLLVGPTAARNFGGLFWRMDKHFPMPRRLLLQHGSVMLPWSMRRAGFKRRAPAQWHKSKLRTAVECSCCVVHTSKLLLLAVLLIVVAAAVFCSFFCLLCTALLLSLDFQQRRSSVAVAANTAAPTVVLAWC